MRTTITMSNTMTDIFNALSSVKGHQFVGLTTDTEVKMNKTGNPYVGRVRKVSSYRASFNYSYENACNNRAERAGNERTFVTEKLPWGEWIKGYENKFIAHKDRVYVRVYQIPTEVAKVEYYLDGVRVDGRVLEDIMRFVPQKNVYSKKQAEVGIIDVDKQVKPYAIDLENIVRITIGGVTYK